jgi:post-segregation antitoxin (ccd killing protein)
MPKMQVYLPDELYERLKAHGEHLNVSGILQEALTRQLADMERREALIAAVADYEAEFGKITEEELREQEEADKRNVTYPPAKKRRRTSTR